MKYFVLKEDLSYENRPIVKNWYKEFDERNLTPEEYDQIPDRTILDIAKNKETEFTDVIVKPIFLISKRVKELLECFEPNMEFKQIILLDGKNKRMNQYFLPLLSKIDCLEESSKLNRDRSVLLSGVINRQKLEDKPLFFLDGMTSREVIIRMDLLECMLKRNMMGFVVEEVVVKEEETCQKHQI